MNENANWEAVAWFIAAEGSIQLCRRNKTTSLTPEVAAYNTEPEILEALMDMTDIGFMYEHKRKSKNHKVCYEWRVYGCEDVKRLLEKLIPYMPSPKKIEVAKLLLEFCNVHNDGSYSPREWEIYQQIKKLNKKGKV